MFRYDCVFCLVMLSEILRCLFMRNTVSLRYMSQCIIQSVTLFLLVCSSQNENTDSDRKPIDVAGKPDSNFDKPENTEDLETQSDKDSATESPSTTGDTKPDAVVAAKATSNAVPSNTDCVKPKGDGDTDPDAASVKPKVKDGREPNATVGAEPTKDGKKTKKKKGNDSNGEKGDTVGTNDGKKGQNKGGDGNPDTDTRKTGDTTTQKESTPVQESSGMFGLNVEKMVTRSAAAKNEGQPGQVFGGAGVNDKGTSVDSANHANLNSNSASANTGVRSSGLERVKENEVNTVFE